MRRFALLRPALLAAALLPLAACDDVSAPDGTAALAAPTRDALALLPPGASTVSMFDVQEAESVGALGDALTQLERAIGEAGGHMDELKSRTGFDPARDLDRVYFAVTDDDPLFVIRATMDRDRLIAFLDDQPEMERSAYRGLPVFSGADADDRFEVVLLSNDLALAGRRADVRAATDRALDGGPSAASDAELAAILSRARYGEAWLVSRGHMHNAPEFDVDAGVISMDFDASGIQVAALAQPAAGTSVDDLVDAVEGAVAMARLQSREDPDLRDLLDGVDVRAYDGAVEVRGSVSDRYIRKMQAH